jgi:predicted protein tyrosine phosphatase
LKVLFICSRNKWRSATAETIYKNSDRFDVKSAGTEPSARIKVNGGHLLWADLIFVMEHKHKKRLLEKFREEMAGKEVVVLDIPDEYQYMDPELIEEIESKVENYLI